MSSGPSHYAGIQMGGPLEDVSLPSRGFNTGLFCFGNLCDVAVHGVVDYGYFGSHISKLSDGVFLGMKELDRDCGG